MSIVNQGLWCQATVSTGAPGIRTAASVLRREGFRVLVSSIGQQVTPVGAVNMTLISVIPLSRADTGGVAQILRAHIPELRT